MKRTLFTVFTIFFLLSMAGAVVAEDSFVVVNDKDWRTVYVSAVYANSIDAEVLSFSNLADAQLKTRFMAPDADIVIIEAESKPVVKNYESFLNINGYENFETIIVEDYVDAQNQLRNIVQPTGLFVFDGKYGFDPLAASAFIYANDYFPYFIPENGDISEAVSLSRRYETITSGHIPVRDAARMRGEVFTGEPYTTIGDVTSKSLESDEYLWGIITRVDAIDIQTLQQGLPFFVFAGNSLIQETSALIGDSGITRFEVIGGVTADIARDIESQVDADLDMLLKYGRRVTNYPGLGNAVLDVDTLPFGYPIESISVQEVAVYPEENVLAITYENEGNIDTYVFSSIEYDGQSQTDAAPLYIQAGEQKTIGYAFDEFDGSATEAVLTVQFGYSFPLQRLLLNTQGSPIYEAAVTEKTTSPPAELTIDRATLDTDRGVIFIDVTSTATNDLQIYAQVTVDSETSVTSIPKTIGASAETVVQVPVPYIENERLEGQEVTITLHYGTDDTIYQSTEQVVIRERLLNTLSGFVTGQTGMISMGVLVIVILIIVIAVIARRKTKKLDGKLQKANKLAKKKSTKKSSTKKAVKKSSTKKKASSKKASKKTTKKKTTKRK